MKGRIIFGVLLLMFVGLQYKLWFDKGSVPRAHALALDFELLVSNKSSINFSLKRPFNEGAPLK